MMEYRILNIEVTALPEKSGELIFLSLPEGHRFLAKSKSLVRFQLCDMGKNPISLWRKTGFSSAIIQRESSEGYVARINPIGTRSSGMHSERDVRNGQDKKSSLEGGGLRSDSGARRRVLAIGASEIENGQNSLWHQHLSRLKPYSPQGETLSLLSKTAQSFENFKDYNNKTSRLSGFKNSQQ